MQRIETKPCLIQITHQLLSLCIVHQCNLSESLITPSSAALHTLWWHFGPFIQITSPFFLKIKMEQVGNHQYPTKATIAFSLSNDQICVLAIMLLFHYT